MIPQFPNFKKLEFSDREEIMNFTKDYPPYSDFNFISLWTWNAEDKFMVSKINKTLIIKFTDYVTNQPFYSFLGNEKNNEAAREINKMTNEQKNNLGLKLVPESSTQNLDLIVFECEEDRDNFDYILSVDNLMLYPGSNFSSKRNYVKRFEKMYNCEIIELDLANKDIQKSVIKLNEEWQLQKNDNYNENEIVAIQRFLDIKNRENLISFGLFVNNKIIGYWFLEDVGTKYAISHFQKANTAYIGVYPYLMKKCAEILKLRDIDFINMEQDLGLENLRQAKNDYRPVRFLKKFKVQSRQEK